MRYVALATDYDGTLAHDGSVQDSTLAALEGFAATGRRLVLVTGRELADLKSVFPHLDLFDRVVAENGALVHDPATGETRALASPPAPALVKELELRGVRPLSIGQAIVATWHPHETTVLEVIRELGLELQVIFNKGAVMVLPTGVNKASGLEAALEELGLSPHNVVAIGDAENDHALLDLAECSAAVANSVPLLLDRADLRMRAPRGAGVEELIGMIVRNDLADKPSRRPERRISLGKRVDGTEISLPAAEQNILITGPSGSGKSTLATSLLEQLMARSYQCCVIDPEGDYDELGNVIVFGSSQSAPGAAQIMTALNKPAESVAVNLLGVKLEDRPGFFAGLLARLQAMRTRTARPHWMLVDEAHHLLPAEWQPAPEFLDVLTSAIYITVHPESLSRALLDKIDVIAAVGEAPQERIDAALGCRRLTTPSSAAVRLHSGEALVWLRAADEAVLVRIPQSRGERRRHLRKYAEGELGPDRSFYFRGPAGKLNLRAQNLALFMQLAEGVDEQTWMHHLKRGDYSRWIGDSIKDAELQAEVGEVEAQGDRVTADVSRERIRAAISQRYTLPAAGQPAAGASR